MPLVAERFGIEHDTFEAIAAEERPDDAPAGTEAAPGECGGAGREASPEWLVLATIVGRAALARELEAVTRGLDEFILQPTAGDGESTAPIADGAPQDAATVEAIDTEWPPRTWLNLDDGPGPTAFDPLQEQIAAACVSIQQSWSKYERRTRAGKVARAWDWRAKFSEPRQSLCEWD